MSALVVERRLSSWAEIVATADALIGQSWSFRGHADARWRLQTSLEREFGPQGADTEQLTLWHFVRTAPRWMPSHLVPDDNDAAAWLGLVQHYGGPTRLLDVTRSLYIAVFFAFEPSGNQDRALWAVEYAWCMKACAEIMAHEEGVPEKLAQERTTAAQAQLVYSLVHRQRHPMPLFNTFKPFSGVFPLDPWKPDARQIAQQAMFLCVANPRLSFVETMAALSTPHANAVYSFILPADLRQQALEQLAMMNVTAATLFPDLSGLARSLGTHPVRRSRPVTT
jgi:hypothetical protein